MKLKIYVHDVARTLELTTFFRLEPHWAKENIRAHIAREWGCNILRYCFCAEGSPEELDTNKCVRGRGARNTNNMFEGRQKSGGWVS